MKNKTLLSSYELLDLPPSENRRIPSLISDLVWHIEQLIEARLVLHVILHDFWYQMCNVQMYVSFVSLEKINIESSPSFSDFHEKERQSIFP